MKVLFATAECWPFVKTGGLGDVSYALPKTLKKQGVDIRVILPKYSTIPNYLKENLKEVAVFSVNVGWRNQYCGLLETELDGVKFYFIDNEYYFKRECESSYIYGFGDDCERYTFFNHAVLKSIEILNFYPDILQLNDWHTGIMPLLLKEKYNFGKYKDIKTVYIIHNLQYQGVFSKNVVGDILDIDNNNFYSIEYFGGINFMKAGINFSNMVTTVSKNYAQEIQTDFYGESLGGLLKFNNHKLRGILNGIDYDINNPKTDKEIFVNYDKDSIENKKQNKLKLQSLLGLEVNENIPMIGIVSRLVSQKGLDLISCVMPQIMKQNVQLVVLGTGEQRYESMFSHFAYENPRKLYASMTFDSSFAQKIYASSDMFLMPSLFEPCGIGQLIAMRYGTLPIVRETGGLKDTVIPYNEYTGCGNGFSFANYNAHEMLDIINYAISVFNNKERFNKLVFNAMSTDNSWEKYAKEYKSLYESMCK